MTAINQNIQYSENQNLNSAASSLLNLTEALNSFNEAVQQSISAMGNLLPSFQNRGANISPEPGSFNAPDIQAAESEVNNTMNILKSGTDSFVSEMLNGFNSISGIIDSITAIIKSAAGLSDGAGILGQIFGFITDPIGTLAGMAGLSSDIHSGMASGFPEPVNSYTPSPMIHNNITILHKSEVEQTRMVKIVSGGINRYNSIQAAKAI